MRNEIKFNDEAVESKVEEIANLGIGHSTIDGKQIKAVKDMLNLRGDSVEELRAKRNSLVKFFSSKTREFYNEEKSDFANFDKYHDAMSGAVMVIDSMMWDLYGEC